MLDIPIGKALIAVERTEQCGQKCKDAKYKCPNYKECCGECEMDDVDIGGVPDDDVCGCLCCIPENRKDRKHVIYRLVDYNTN